MKAADRFHCPPWELLERGTAWVAIATATVEAENQAAFELQKRAERRARMERARRSAGGGGFGR